MVGTCYPNEETDVQLEKGFLVIFVHTVAKCEREFPEVGVEVKQGDFGEAGEH